MARHDTPLLRFCFLACLLLVPHVHIRTRPGPPALTCARPSCASASRLLDLGPLLSPEQQAVQAVDLNLRLMRWRAAPRLDTLRMATLKCLLIGACCS